MERCSLCGRQAQFEIGGKLFCPPHVGRCPSCGAKIDPSGPCPACTEPVLAPPLPETPPGATEGPESELQAPQSEESELEPEPKPAPKKTTKKRTTRRRGSNVRK